GSNVAFVANKTSDLDVFTDGLDLLGGQVSDGHLAANCFGSVECFNVSWICLNNSFCTGLNKCLELSVLSNEVGLCVYFDNNANFFSGVNVCFYDTFSSDTASFFSSSSQTSFTQQFDCLVLIAVSLGQCFFALHHAAAGDFTQCFY